LATSDLFARVLKLPALQSLAQRAEGGGLLSFDGIDAGAQPFLIAVLRRCLPARPIVVVTEGLRQQEVFHQDLSTWLRMERAQPGTAAQVQTPWFYPSWEILPHEERLPHVDVISERLETLLGLQPRTDNTPVTAPIVVTSVSALLQRTFPSTYLREHTRTVARRDRLDPLDLVEWLEDQGYEPEAQVSQKGEIALRGGILDVYPLTSPWPVRLEFFGDELESLRFFDPITQISREEVGAATLPPAGELGLLKRARNKALSGTGPGTSPAQPAGPGGTTQLGTFLDYLPTGTLFVLCEPETLEERAEEYDRQVPDQDSFYQEWNELQEKARAQGMTLLALQENPSQQEVEGSDLAHALAPAPQGVEGQEQEQEEEDTRTSWQSEQGEGGQSGAFSLPLFQGLEAFRAISDRPPEPQVAETQRREFFAQLHRWLRQEHQVHVFCNNDGERRRFAEIWEEYGLGGAPPPTGSVPAGESVGPWVLEGGLSIHQGTLSRGFLSDTAKLVVVTDAEIFGRYKVQRPRRLKSPHAQATRSALDIDFTDLDDGDFVVHLQHGIGRYLGLEVLPLGAGTKPLEGTAAGTAGGQECLVIEYAPSDPSQPNPKLYVPVTEAHLVSKYVGTGKARPPLNTLGGTRWAKAKAQAERAVRDVASELLSIQAARESQAGHAFKTDTPWQREFEGAFLFEETPDQMRAILETKTDMERPKPMDRLICGDVGFGKTEVGIRAAFKAVMEGKQVAVLVPTTVLAQQHYNTFRERMADYPIRIELLSRFRTRRAQQKVVKDLAAGSVDIVIGTHRLLQADIGFKDLGLVVIDEEQRFGVLHKEKFKMLRRLVDVLTLSATPIPRTLYLALTGARDMSTIQTPPHDRLPVETVVTQYDERVIRDAIRRELNRGGQVFFLHNRVMTIQTMAQKLAALVPEARMVVGHGQMDSDELEEVMTRFINGEADVLLSTTIIESGLDIPNANTIIIDRADRFGLSDLYQLRGRVGRYKHQAYAYLLLPRHANLLADVRKRLSAIKQYSTLGSGFKIAMRDLEIRGAGNLLGAEQSGHITAVGFDLYCQLLKQSISSIKGEKVKPRVEVQVRLDFLALNPAEERSRADEAGRPEPAEPAPAQASQAPASAKAAPSLPAAAYLPFNYIADARQRIEIYRKLAQATDKPSLQGLERELRDRFGPPPEPVSLLLKVTELRVLAAERGITVMEVKEDKVMLTRNNDYVMAGTRFPRLTKKSPAARLNEIQKLLSVL
jgi:transcription-repair coupling factor (superfamily II helicase)